MTFYGASLISSGWYRCLVLDMPVLFWLLILGALRGANFQRPSAAPLIQQDEGGHLQYDLCIVAGLESLAPSLAIGFPAQTWGIKSAMLHLNVAGVWDNVRDGPWMTMVSLEIDGMSHLGSLRVHLFVWMEHGQNPCNLTIFFGHSFEVVGLPLGALLGCYWHWPSPLLGVWLGQLDWHICLGLLRMEGCVLQLEKAAALAFGISCFVCFFPSLWNVNLPLCWYLKRVHEERHSSCNCWHMGRDCSVGEPRKDRDIRSVADSKASKGWLGAGDQSPKFWDIRQANTCRWCIGKHDWHLLRYFHLRFTLTKPLRFCRINWLTVVRVTGISPLLERLVDWTIWEVVASGHPTSYRSTVSFPQNDLNVVLAGMHDSQVKSVGRNQRFFNFSHQTCRSDPEDWNSEMPQMDRKAKRPTDGKEMKRKNIWTYKIW